ncbi:MAG: AGE family epimerase/isomerase [Acidobacteria bacterium]|nr:AGE family epimerase/isomerase [Acidobacteriota bacterium]
MDLSSFLEAVQSRYRRNLFESVIPFWEKHSLDREQGGQLHCLGRDGSVYDTRKYVWMQGRAVWMFSRLYNTVEQRPEWLEAARGILDFLLPRAFAPDGRCYFALTRDGRPAAMQRKPYAAFFVALALIEFHKTGAARENHIPLAKDLFRRIQEWIADAGLLGRPSYAGQIPYRQLADIMVVASLALELMEVDDDPIYPGVLRRCLGEAREHWLPARRTLLENLPLDGSDYRALPEMRLLCPGSALEVAWFLWHALEKLGEESAQNTQFLLDVMEGTLETGWDSRHGGLLYFMDAEGLPALQLEASMKLWWPHTEAIYALALAYCKTRDAKWLEWWRRVDEYTFDVFPDWEHGEWFGYCDRTGEVASTLKGGPYKGFFHVPRCLLFTLQRTAGVLS